MMMHEVSPPPARKRRKPAAEWLRRVRHSESEAELFLAYDLARQGIEEHPHDAALKHRAVLCLASTGASERAAEEFRKFDLAGIARNPPPDMPPKLAFDIASLEARLLKDAAVVATGPERIPKLLAAAAAYEAIFDRMEAARNPESYYPGVNCATLRLLAGDTEGALAFARKVLDRLDTWPFGNKGYYEIATELEARLIIGDLAAAEAASHQVAALMRGRSEQDLRALATTIRQLRLLVDAKHIGPEAAAGLAPPRVIHFTGHIIAPPGRAGKFPASLEAAVKAQIIERLDRGDIGFAYGSLAAGADILFAEALLDRKINLGVVLPFTVEEFVEVSVRPSGARWVERFWRCYKGAATMRFATEDRYLGDDSLFGYCSQLAMGRALLRARHLCAPVEQVAVWDGGPPSGAAGTAIDIAAWQTTGMPQTIIRLNGDAGTASGAGSASSSANRRRTRAMLFGDVKGFSKLTDEQLPHFVESVLGAFGRVIHRFADDTLLVNTWGDGLFLVFDDAGKAAECALALQEAMAAVDLVSAGLPETMALRLGGHLGPVYAARDPILEHENYFGAHVSRAARIEPVTPEKLVYVTETLAAVLALHNADAFDCSYVGMTKAAKDYGEMRMFLLRRRLPTPSTTFPA